MSLRMKSLNVKKMLTILSTRRKLFKWRARALEPNNVFSSLAGSQARQMWNHTDLSGRESRPSYQRAYDHSLIGLDAFFPHHFWNDLKMYGTAPEAGPIEIPENILNSQMLFMHLQLVLELSRFAHAPELRSKCPRAIAIDRRDTNVWHFMNMRLVRSHLSSN